MTTANETEDTDTAPTGALPPFSNVEHKKPLRIKTLVENLTTLTDGWPVSVGRAPGAKGMLVTPDGDGFAALDDIDDLIEWLDDYAPVRWESRMAGARTKGEFFAAVTRRVKNYEWAALTPHYPRKLPNVLYTRSRAKPNATGALAALIDRFAPATPIDRTLLTAYTLTPFWSGPPGRRPPFLFTGKTNADGTGIGKTTTIEVLADLVGGAVTIDGTERKRVIEALLAPSAMWQRVALLDNVAGDRYGSDRIESLITARNVDGHRLHHGRATRPNYLTWAISANDPAFSHDLSGRVVPITLDRPKASAQWYAETAKLIRDTRAEIEADVAAIFATEPKAVVQVDRWPEWGAEVLGRLDKPEAVLKMIAERRVTVDADDRDRTDVVAAIRAHLEREYPNADLDAKRIRISMLEAVAWLRTVFHGETQRQLEHRLHRAHSPRLRPAKTKKQRVVWWEGASTTDDTTPVTRIYVAPAPGK